MKRFLVLWRRELAACFVSPVAYVIQAFFLTFMGFSFWMLVALRTSGPVDVNMVKDFFTSISFWVGILVSVPIITMRLVAEEKRVGTIETLMTAPVRETEVVLAKYFGAVLFFVALWTPTIGYFFVLRLFIAGSASFGFGMVLTAYFGTFLIGAFYISLGLLASALSRNQVVAGMMSFSLICLCFFTGFLSSALGDNLLGRIVTYGSSVEHMLDFSRGIIDTRPIVFYASGACAGLLATVRCVQTGKWR
ncbi:MAG: ABC transporter permease subunit [Kiritimatiellae bacterium]|nr:ABC transporter permease subunit [Kiritimatiellia bacterium]